MMINCERVVDFISYQSWINIYVLVKEMLPQAEDYVFEVDKMIQGFVGLNNEYIEGAISFYQKEGFIIQCEGLDEATGEKEYTMLWKQK